MRKAAIDIIGFDACMGCFLCKDVCRHGAIEMVVDRDGFYKPVIDELKCNACGACSMSCPVIRSSNNNEPFESPLLYGAWSTDNDTVSKSSSGGLFYEVASVFIENGGKVCGVEWQGGVPRFSLVSTADDLRPLMGSKYLQADAQGIYKEVRAAVRNGEAVLFFGLPCQVQALGNYVKSENLYLVDLVCAGVPSLNMYHSYCREYFPEQECTHTDFRVKAVRNKPRKPAPWRRYSVEFYSTEYLLLSQEHSRNDFFVAFNSTKCYNSACYSCGFNSIPRRGDITLCDFWGASEQTENPEGTSLVSINSEKGKKLFGNVMQKRNDRLHVFPTDIQTAVAGTRRFDMSRRDVPPEREKIFRTFRKSGFRKMYRKFFKMTLKRRLLLSLKARLPHLRLF